MERGDRLRAEEGRATFAAAGDNTEDAVIAGRRRCDFYPILRRRRACEIFTRQRAHFGRLLRIVQSFDVVPRPQQGCISYMPSTPRDYPLRSELRRLATELRNVVQRAMSMEAVERAQHCIVRLEEAAKIWPSDLDAATKLYLEARAVLAECRSSSSTPKGGGRK